MPVRRRARARGPGLAWTVFYGVPLIVFGIQHFLYAQFISTLIPVWIPRRLFWAYFVGTAFIAAAVSIATKGQARLAAILLGAMFLSWVIIVHAPRVAAHLRNGNEWTSAFIALAMCGGAWIVAGSQLKSIKVGSCRMGKCERLIISSPRPATVSRRVAARLLRGRSQDQGRRL